jgi:hypothetical protein
MRRVLGYGPAALAFLLGAAIAIGTVVWDVLWTMLKLVERLRPGIWQDAGSLAPSAQESSANCAENVFKSLRAPARSPSG